MTGTPSVANGNWGTCATTLSLNVGGTCEQQCNDGFFAAPGTSGTVTCTARGVWSTPSLVCQQQRMYYVIFIFNI